MFKCKIIIVSIVIIYQFPMNFCCLLHASDRELADFMSNYPGAVNRLKQAYSRVVMTGRFRGKADFDPSNPKPRSESKLVVSIQNNDKKCFHSTDRTSPDASGSSRIETVMAFGEGYAFNLRRSKDTNDTFTITWIGKRSAATDGMTIKDAEFIARGGKFAWCTYMNETIDFSRVLDKATYKILSADRLVDGGTEVCRVKFANAAGNPSPLTGVADLLPGRSWAIRRLEVEWTFAVKAPGLPTSATMTTRCLSTVDYDGDRDGVPIPKLVATTKDHRTSTFEFDEMTLGTKTPARAFTLGYFGLPDVTAPPADPDRNSLIPWLIGLAFASLIGAVAVMRKRTKGHGRPA